MNILRYIRDCTPVILRNTAGMFFLSLYLYAIAVPYRSILMILFIWGVVSLSCLITQCLLKKKKYDDMWEILNEMPEKYLFPEILSCPYPEEDRQYYEIMQVTGKSMLEKVEQVQKEKQEYREYIEQWIHELKVPLTTVRLTCENHRDDMTRKILAEFEKLNNSVEMVLYYARMDKVEKDYLIREVRLSDIIKSCLAQCRTAWIKAGIMVSVENMEQIVYTDEKWTGFILSQILWNSYQYRTEDRPQVKIYTEKRHTGGQPELSLIVEDNGSGIPDEEIERIFEKGFTGTNGRNYKKSTGMGLYICRKLCGHLQIGMRVTSLAGSWTKVYLDFKDRADLSLKNS